MAVHVRFESCCNCISLPSSAKQNNQVLCILKKERLRHSKVKYKFVFHKVSSPPSPSSLLKLPIKPIWRLTWKHVLGERSKFPATIHSRPQCYWQKEMEALGTSMNTLRVDGEIFESGKKKLRIQKYPDTCGQGLSLRVFISRHFNCHATPYFSTSPAKAIYIPRWWGQPYGHRQVTTMIGCKYSWNISQSI